MGFNLSRKTREDYKTIIILVDVCEKHGYKGLFTLHFEDDDVVIDEDKKIDKICLVPDLDVSSMKKVAYLLGYKPIHDVVTRDAFHMKFSFRLPFMNYSTVQDIERFMKLTKDLSKERGVEWVDCWDRVKVDLPSD